VSAKSAFEKLRGGEAAGAHGGRRRRVMKGRADDRGRESDPLDAARSEPRRPLNTR
jgi:hypothetical protein